MDALVRECEGRGIWKLLSRVFPENGPSRKLLAKVGFREVGTYRRHAKLDGEWRDNRHRRATHRRGRPLNVAQLLVKCLENEGVRHVFGIPGEETLALNAALADSDKIKFILTRHEQGGRVHGRCLRPSLVVSGVCLATLGPGATNLITGVADAQIDRAPLVAITGQVGLERSHKESHQYCDIVRMFGP